MSQFWLLKTEPNTYSIDTLKSEGKTHWEGIRNYQARNFMRDKMKVGDTVFIYHSNAKPTGIVGTGTVSSAAYPDFFALDGNSKYYDPKATKEKPIWMMVDISFKEKFDQIITLQELRTYPELKDMLLLKKGMRLSIQPVTQEAFNFILSLAR